MAKGNGADGAAKPPSWWEAAKNQLIAELEPRFQSIEAKLAIVDMKVDAVDRRVTRLVAGLDDRVTRVAEGLDRRVTRLSERLDHRLTRLEAGD